LLKARGVGEEQVRDRIASIVKPGTGRHADDLPYTSRAKRILELAMSEARALNHSEVNTGHLFLGVMREEKGIGAGVLAEFGFTIDDTLLEFGRMTNAGRTEVAAGEHVRVINAPHAVAMLKALAASPRVADIFARHGVDVEAIIRDLLAGEPTS
jgi:ATP-dependent Clp protease ATP-binding subunit ClpA